MSFLSIITRFLSKKRISSETPWAESFDAVLQEVRANKEAKANKIEMPKSYQQYSLERAKNYLLLRKREAVKGFVPTRWWETDVRLTIATYRKECGIPTDSYTNA